MNQEELQARKKELVSSGEELTALRKRLTAANNELTAEVKDLRDKLSASEDRQGQAQADGTKRLEEAHKELQKLQDKFDDIANDNEALRSRLSPRIRSS